MQKTIEKIEQQTSKQTEENTLTLKQIEEFYKNESKTETFGLEYERLSLDKKTLKNASYDQMAKIITDFSKILDWELVLDNETIIGAKDNIGNSVSLEPGCQMEISIKPCKNILEIDLTLTKYVDLLDKIADIYDVCFLGYGVSPYSNVDEISLLSKKRYEIMNNYLPNCYYGELCQKMMRKTAGIQVNIDYSDNKDAYNKIKFLNLIMPFMSGLFSNSPIENNSLADNKSQRSYIWQYTGKNRCNFFYKDVFKGFNQKKNIFKNYIKSILDVPMVFIERNNETIPINGKINFLQFLSEGYDGHFATMEDYVLHQSLCFPDVRLKKYIEIRNHDSQCPEMAIALCAFYKGLMDTEIENLLKKFSYLKIEDIEKNTISAAKFGLDFKINNKDAWEVVVELYKIASSNLSAKERSYLKPVLEIIKTRKSNADILIDYGYKTAKDVVEYYLN